jgi:competence protein ComEC
MKQFSNFPEFTAKAPFVPFCIAFAGGIVLQYFFSIPPVISSIVFTVLLILILVVFFKKTLAENKISWLFLALFFIMGILRLSIWEENNLRQSYLPHLPIRADTLQAEIRSIQNRNRPRVFARLKELQVDSLSVNVSGQILVYFPYQYHEKITPGQIVKVIDALIEPLPEPRNPGQFDYGKFLRWRGIVAQCKIEDSLQIKPQVTPSKFSHENHIFYPFRKYLLHKIDTDFSPRKAGFLKALLLGVREDLPPEIAENFQKAGVMHVLAISGLHVGFVALIFYIFLSFFPIYFKHRNILVVFLLIFYMFLTGSNPPVVRATIMAAMFFLAINLERRGAVYNYLFAAAFTILLFQPQQIFWIGFQFSFAAVLSIVYFYPRLTPLSEKLLEYIYNEKWRHRLHKWIMIPLIVSIASQLGTIPLVMHYFHLFSPVAFVLNIIVIPYIGIMVSLGFLFLFFSLVSGALGALFADFISFLIDFLINLVSGAADLPAAYFRIPGFGLLEILIYLLLVLLLFHFQNETQRRFFAISSAALAIIWITLQITNQPAFNLLMLDVGQGDGALITTPQGKTILIDAGPASEYGSAADRAIIPVMQHLEIRNINHLFISHPHSDHLGGTFRLLQFAGVDSVYFPPVPFSYHWNDTLLQVLDRTKIPHRLLKTGERLIIDEETRVYVLAPFPQWVNQVRYSDANLNNLSLVLLIKHRDHTLLFTGDTEVEVEDYLQLWEDILKSDFMKVAHHGSNTSTSEDFLALVNPDFSGISLAENNKFSHPSPKVLKRLSAYESRVFRTDKHKAIWLRVREGKWERVLWDQGGWKN